LLGNRENLYASLLGQPGGNLFASEDRLVTIHDVAAAAGVSIATVSRALNGGARISAQTRQRVLDIVDGLGYQPNDLARSLLAGSSGTIAVILPDITNPFFPELVKAVEEEVNRRGNLLLLCHSADDEQKALADLIQLRRKQVDGVIVLGGQLSGDRLAGVVQGLAVVTVDRDVRLPGVSSVQSDHRGGARAATQHLLDLGHTQVAFVGGPKGLSVSRDRQRGYRDALKRAGIAHDPALESPGDFLEDGGYLATKALLAKPAKFTAVVAGNDLTAIGVMAALLEAGRTVPDDVSVVGYDDIRLASYVRPRLTTVRQSTGDLGRRAAALLYEAISGTRTTPVHEVLPVDVVIRESSAAPALIAKRGRRRG
jgi:DNA-binding LacI/PurR family transcriptional regulator